MVYGRHARLKFSAGGFFDFANIRE